MHAARDLTVKWPPQVAGQLSVSISSQGVRIDQGWFEAKPPGGMIRYQQDLQLSLEAADPQLQLVRDVLLNFEYDSLRAEVNYSEQEKLLLAVQIQGADNGWQKKSNPYRQAWNDGAG